MNKSRHEANAALDKLLIYNIQKSIQYANKSKKEVANQNAFAEIGQFYDYEAAKAYGNAAMICARNIQAITGADIEQIITAICVVSETASGKESDVVPSFIRAMKTQNQPFFCESKRKSTRFGCCQNECRGWSVTKDSTLLYQNQGGKSSGNDNKRL